MASLVTLLVLLSLLSHADHAILARQTLPDSAALNISTSTFSKSIHNSSQVAFPTNLPADRSLGLTDVPTPLPSPLNEFDPGGLQNWQDLNSGSCPVVDQFCSYEGLNKTTGEASISVFADKCLLWDTSCAGNKTFAIEEFLNSTKSGLQNNHCFSNYDSGNEGISIPEVAVGEGTVLEDTAPSSDCKTYNPPERISAWKKIKNWMRSQECVSARAEWVKLGGHVNMGDPEDYLNFSSSSCCGKCAVVAVSVDLYYWPERDIDTSCLSIIGTSVRPYNYGATTMPSPNSEIYWACTAKTPVTSTTTWTDVNTATVHTTTTTISMITTAAVMSIESLSIKVPLINPWFTSPCVETDEKPRSSNGSNDSRETHVEHTSIQARDHSLIASSPITQPNALPVSTTVMGNFTL